MNNEAEINVEIPEITAMFVGTKGKYGFAQVVDDFPNAKEVRILTYSRIGYGNNNLKLRELQTLSPETKLCIIVALPGLKNPKIDGQYEHNQFREDSIVMELGKIKQQFDISQYFQSDSIVFICIIPNGHDFIKIFFINLLYNRLIPYNHTCFIILNAIIRIVCRTNIKNIFRPN